MIKISSENKFPIVYSNQNFTRVAADITNYCNARCVWCFNSWDKQHIDMTEKIFSKLLEILPFVNDGRLFFSCLYEPTLNPDFMKLLEMIPARFRNKVFFTTNLVEYISDELFHRLAKAEVRHINVSIETFDPGLYRKLIKTKKSCFYDNLGRMVNIFSKYPLAPKIRCITMILRANCDELASLAKTVNDRIRPIAHEFRTPYFIVNENIKSFKNQLLPEKKIYEAVQKLKALNYENLLFDIRGNLEAYELLLEKSDFEQSQEASTQTRRADLYDAFQRNNHYTVTLSADGKGLLVGNNETFDLNKIAEPSLFFQERISYLQNMEAEWYANCNQELLECKQNDEKLHGVLDSVHLIDSRYLSLRGYIISGKDSTRTTPSTNPTVFSDGWVTKFRAYESSPQDKFIVINGVAVFRASVEARNDIYRSHGIANAGFFCRIDLRELDLSVDREVIIEAAVCEDNYLRSTVIAKISVL